MSQVTIDVEGIREAQDALNTVKGGLSPFPDRIKEKIAKTIRDLIYQRTLTGKDRFGQFFAPYSGSYSETKQGMGSSVVNLYLTGHMFKSMTERLDNDDALVFFADDFANKKAHWHISGAGKLPTRDFFGASEQEVQASVVKGIIQVHLDGLIRTAENGAG